MRNTKKGMFVKNRFMHGGAFLLLFRCVLLGLIQNLKSYRHAINNQDLSLLIFMAK